MAQTNEASGTPNLFVRLRINLEVLILKKINLFYSFIFIFSILRRTCCFVWNINIIGSDGLVRPSNGVPVERFPGFIGWLTIYFAQSFSILLIGKIIVGASAGAVFSTGIIIIGEFSAPSQRGSYLNMKVTGVNIGSALIHFLDKYMHWRTTALLALIPTAVSFLVACTWPESPAWLASKK